MAGNERFTTGNDVIDGLQLMQANVGFSPEDTVADVLDFLRIGFKLVGVEKIEDRDFMVSGVVAFGRDMHQVAGEPEFFTHYNLEGTITGVDFLSTRKPPLPIQSLVVNIKNPTLLYEDEERAARAAKLVFQVPILAITSCISS